MIVVGDIINQGSSAALTAVTARNQGTGQTLRVTASGKTYTPGRFLMITASVNPTSIGAMMAIMADLGSGVAETGAAHFYNNATSANSSTEITPVVGDTIQEVDFTSLTGALGLRFAGAYGVVAGSGKAVFRNFRLTGSSPSKLCSLVNVGQAIVLLVECINACLIVGLHGQIYRLNVSNLSGAGIEGPYVQHNIIGGINQNLTGFTVQGIPTFGGGFLTLGPIYAFTGYTVNINGIQLSTTATAGRRVLVVNAGSKVQLSIAASISFNNANGPAIADVAAGNLLNVSTTTWALTIVTNGTETALPFKIAGQTAVNTFTVATGVWSAGATNITLASLDAAFAGKACDPRSGSSIHRIDLP